MAARRRQRSTPVAKSERRQQILHAAREVFAKRGYHHATIDDVVAQAGVARGTFYLYFEDKRAVFSDLIDRFSAKLAMAIISISTDDPQRAVSEQVYQNIRTIIATCLADRTMTRILFTDAVGLDSDFDRKLGTFYDTLVQMLTESLKEGQRLGIVGDGEPRVLAYLSLGALKELLYQAVTLGLAEESAEVLTNHIFAFLSHGYLRAPTTPAKPVTKSVAKGSQKVAGKGDAGRGESGRSSRARTARSTGPRTS